MTKTTPRTTSIKKRISILPAKFAIAQVLSVPPLTLKTCSRQMCNDSVQCQVVIRKIAVVVRVFRLRRTRSFYALVLQRTAKKCTRIYNARAQLLFCSVNLLFGDVLVAVIVEVCSLFCPIGEQQLPRCFDVFLYGCCCITMLVWFVLNCKVLHARDAFILIFLDI